MVDDSVNSSMLARSPAMGQDVNSILMNDHAPFLFLFFPSHNSLTIKLLIILKSEKLLNANLINHLSDSDANDLFVLSLFYQKLAVNFQSSYG